ncbi:MAG: aspartate-semialdehyde dehydrogenase [Flavobacteriales bacterium]|nr:aspartate-semialdehyde dehydrogenase [Flavobacteriales bacterium]
MRVAVVGATGMVGRKMLQVLEERDFPISELILVGRSTIGEKVDFRGEEITVVDMQTAIDRAPDVALFSAGGGTSLEWAPKFAETGAVVIDNSSAWRMDNSKKLVVPEVNGSSLTASDRIIANPNCSTIQMVVALKPLYDRYGVERLVISTYQSVSGTGKAAVEQMENERAGKEGDQVYPYTIDKNCLPHCDVFMDNGYTKEEMKLVHETRKIMGDDSIRITATAVRVPVDGGHSESVNVEFKEEFDIDEVRSLLEQAPGVTLVDDVENNRYPMPLYGKDTDDVYVGRLRRDESQEKTLNMWVVSDNLRKGAATNTVQIAEELIRRGILQRPVEPSV